MQIDDWTHIYTYILDFEQRGLVTRTFRRLDPERQQHIIRAILDEAIEKGPTDLNIKQVAERAGVSVGALYMYFNDRDGLLTFAVELCVRFVTDSFNSFRSYFVDLPLRDALAAYLLGGLEWGQAQADFVRFFARAAYHSDSALIDRFVRPIASLMREIVSEILARAAARGEIRADVDLEATARLIHALTIAVGDSQLLPYLNAYFQVNDETIAPERTVEAMLTLLLRGIAPHSARGDDENTEHYS